VIISGRANWKNGHFSFRHKLGFGKNGYNASSQFSALMAKTGAQIYVLPAKIKPTSYNEVWVWCEKHNVPLGVAKLN